MPTSKDPAKARRQRANLRPDAAVKHGAYTEEKVAPLRERFADELREQFGAVASPDELDLAADRRARVAVISDWLDNRGLLADKRSGRPRAVVQLADRLQSAYERQLADLRRRGGGAPRDDDQHDWLELSADEKIGLLAADGLVRTETAHRILERIGEEHHAAHLTDEGLDEAAIAEQMGRRRELVERARASRHERRAFLRAVSDDGLAELERLAGQSES